MDTENGNRVLLGGWEGGGGFQVSLGDFQQEEQGFSFLNRDSH